MKQKVLLILVDGMRPDAIPACGNAFAQRLVAQSVYYPDATTVMPSVTLPCHMSLFHSVVPQRHGILTNTYVPQVRPVQGLFERIASCGGTCASFYNWEQLRDLAAPGSLMHSELISQNHVPHSDWLLTLSAVRLMEERQPDFLFLYLGETDETGHKTGWMTPDYLETVNQAWNCIEYAVNAVQGEYAVIVTADHGGHDRVHGTEMPEDLTIPIALSGVKGQAAGQACILDIAPTVAYLMGFAPDDEWEGRSLLG